jgi:flagellar protein FlbD
VIKLTRLNGEQVLVNPDLIETLEDSPNVTIALTTGRHIAVLESADEVVELIRHWRQALQGDV